MRFFRDLISEKSSLARIVSLILFYLVTLEPGDARSNSRCACTHYRFGTGGDRSGNVEHGATYLYWTHTNSRPNSNKDYFHTISSHTTPECWSGSIHSKPSQDTVSTFETHCLEGKLTFGDPFLDSRVAHNRWLTAPHPRPGGSSYPSDPTRQTTSQATRARRPCGRRCCLSRACMGSPTSRYDNFIFGKNMIFLPFFSKIFYFHSHYFSSSLRIE